MEADAKNPLSPSECWELLKTVPVGRLVLSLKALPVLLPVQYYVDADELTICLGHFTIPERSVIPKPIQKPHPPLWVAATSPESWQIAGQLGIGALGLTLFLTVGEVAEQIHTYKREIKQARPVGKFVNDQVGAFTIVHCAETEEQARANGGHDAALWYMRYAFQVLAARGRDAQKIGPYEEFRKAHPIIGKVVDNSVTFEELDAEDMVIVGDPDKCVRKLEKYQAAGIDRILCLMQAGRIPHDAVMKSIRLFGKHVIPHFSSAAS